jgi:hypothetical protein
MLKPYAQRLWSVMRRDPVLLTLLLIAAAYFILYYITDPVRPGGMFTGLGYQDWGSSYLGWFSYYDQGQYLRLAHTLAGFHFHELYTTYTYGVGYPLVAVPFIWLGFSKDPFVFFNFAAFIFTIYAVYKVGYRLISPFAGFLAAFGLMLATPLIKYVDQPYNSTVCLVVISVILLTFTTKVITKQRAILLGLLLGWAFAARYADVFFLGLLALAAVYRGSFKVLVKHAAYMAVAGSIILIPVLYSQYKVFGSPFRTPYVNHLGIGGVDGSDQGLKAYNIKRAPRAGLALLVSPRLAGGTDGNRGLFIDFFWAFLAIPGIIILLKKRENKVFFYTLIAVGFASTLFYLSFRASTTWSLRYGWLHYTKMFWPCLAILAAAFFDYIFVLGRSNSRSSVKPKKV